MEFENESAWVQELLQPGERVIWNGFPRRRGVLRLEDLILIPISIAMCYIIVQVEMHHFQEKNFMMMVIVGAIFGPAGLQVLIGRFIGRWFEDHKKHYALTTQRVIEKNGKSVRTLNLSYLPPITVYKRRKGFGDIEFGKTFVLNSKKSDRYLMRFENISDFETVKYRIESAAQQARFARIINSTQE